jgi:HK97 family phage portal protein
LKFSILGKTVEIKDSAAPPNPRDDEGWRNYLSGRGYKIGPIEAIKVSAVLRSVDVIAKTLASLPLGLYMNTDQGKEKAILHPVYKLIHRLPNPYTTAYDFWHMYIFNLLLTRGAYAKIVRNRAGVITSLWNIPTANVSEWQINKINGERYVIINLGEGQSERLRFIDILHTPNLRFTSDLQAEDPLTIAADVLGLNTALNGYAIDFFTNGTNSGGFITHPDNMSEEAYTRFKETWNKTYSGVLNQHKVGFLEEGMQFKEMGRNPEESQALESRKFAIVEICRLFGVPPHKVFDLERATFSNIEEQNTEFVQDAVTPNAVRIEQSMYRDLLLTREQEIYFARWNINGLMRGDTTTRTAYYHNARQDGWLNADDIRELEDMNKLPVGQGGEIYAVNGNMIPLSMVPYNKPKGAQANEQNK